MFFHLRTRNGIIRDAEDPPLTNLYDDAKRRQSWSML